MFSILTQLPDLVVVVVTILSCGHDIWLQSCGGICQGDSETCFTDLWCFWNVLFTIESSHECLRGLNFCSLQQHAEV